MILRCPIHEIWKNEKISWNKKCESKKNFWNERSKRMRKKTQSCNSDFSKNMIRFGNLTIKLITIIFSLNTDNWHIKSLLGIFLHFFGLPNLWIDIFATKNYR
jgi:hypothetical protein